MKLLGQNLLLGISLMLIPALAEMATALLGHHPGIGLDILLYRPFHFAFAGLAILLFAALNARIFARSAGSKLGGALVGAVFAVLWFALAFVAVAQLHLIRGGSL
ncbi:hypothetical protein [Pseudoxanthomonas sp. Root65]|uniref:hypothetical protein n=1 Tax=Pseudoxanthomonas sp. Root65 TaxID=1736576 RepID=UPI0012E3EDB6|nr:hypothetical protein [Pseudoxanthomonas sp. Root65]